MKLPQIREQVGDPVCTNCRGAKPGIAGPCEYRSGIHGDDTPCEFDCCDVCRAECAECAECADDI